MRNQARVLVERERAVVPEDQRLVSSGERVPRRRSSGGSRCRRGGRAGPARAALPTLAGGGRGAISSPRQARSSHVQKARSAFGLRARGQVERAHRPRIMPYAADASQRRWRARSGTARGRRRRLRDRRSGGVDGERPRGGRAGVQRGVGRLGLEGVRRRRRAGPWSAARRTPRTRRRRRGTRASRSLRRPRTRTSASRRWSCPSARLEIVTVGGVKSKFVVATSDVRQRSDVATGALRRARVDQALAHGLRRRRPTAGRSGLEHARIQRGGGRDDRRRARRAVEGLGVAGVQSRR